MTQHIELDYTDPVHEGFFDPIQELLGASAPSLNITVQNATTLQIVASTGNSQASVAIDGRYRYRTSNTTASLPGGLADGTHDVYVTATDNDFSGGVGDPDAGTNYSFSMEIKTSGATPSTPLYRLVGYVDVVSGAITAFRQTAGAKGGEGGSVSATAEHATQAALRVKGASSQSASIVRVDDSTGAALLEVTSSGDLRLASARALKIGTDTGITRGAANRLDTDDTELRAKRAASASIGFSTLVTGDTVARLAVDAAGKMLWGDGSGAGDTNLYRNAANQLKTDDKFYAALGLDAGGAKITSADTPTTATDVATKGYVDAISGFLTPGTGLTLVGNTLNVDTSVIGALAGTNTWAGLNTFNNGIAIADAKNIAVGSTTGTKIGTATSQKLGFFNATPIVQPTSTTDLRTLLINLGLLATGGASPLNLNGGALTSGAASVTTLSASGTSTLAAVTGTTGSFSSTLGVTGILTASGGITMADATNLVVGTTGGTQIATGGTQKLGFWGVTPVVRPTALTNSSGLSGASTLPLGYSMDELAKFVLQMWTQLKTIGILQ